MDLVLASNFDDALVKGVADLPVSTFFGNFPVTLTGGGRPPQILPPVDDTRFREHVAAVHRSRRRFYATLNSSELSLQEYDPGFARNLAREVDHLVDLGVDGFVIAIPALIELIHRDYPDLPISVSTFARIRTITQAEFFLRLGAETIVIEEANRDFALLRGLVRAGARVEVLVNQTCIQSCPYRAHHLNTSSVASQQGVAGPWFEYPLLECGLEMIRDPTKLISSILVRPEDLSLYEENGVQRFKISGRNKPTPWLLRAAQAYAHRRYDGNLLDILSFVQAWAPLGALRALEKEGAAPGLVTPLRNAFDVLGSVVIDNRAFPPGFLRKIAETDCAHLSCAECGYCGRIAERVLRVGGRPLSEYRTPENLPATTPLLPCFGSASLPARK